MLKKTTFVSFYVVLLLFCLLLSPSLRSDEPGATLPGSFGKKLIHCGWDQYGGQYLERHYSRLESFMPYDGLAITLAIRDSEGKQIGRSGWCWNNQAWSWDNLRADVEALQRCDFKRFKHNFIYTGANGNSKLAPDYFIDEHWEAVADNMALMARAAKQSSCVGLIFDPESYTSFKFTYDSKSGKSYAETADMARKRGAQVMAALAREYPDMHILFYWLLSMSSLSSDPSALERAGYGLYPHFINGLLDAMPAEMTLIDASENGYWYKNKGSFLSTYQAVHSAACPNLDPRHKEKYRRQVLSGFGIYLDSHVRRSGYSVPPIDGSQLRAFRYQLSNALQTADKYVWLYGERNHWLGEADGSTWEDAFPGMLRAIELSQKPELILAELPQAIADGKLSNLVANSEFSRKAESPGQVNEQDFESSSLWGFWTWGKGKVSLDETCGYDSDSSAAVDPGTLLIHTLNNVSETETYFISVKAKSQGEPSLSIGWQTEAGTWCSQENNQLQFFQEDSKLTDWRQSHAFVRVPCGAHKLVSMMSARNEPSNFDKLVIYKLDDLYEPPNTYAAYQKRQEYSNLVRNADFVCPTQAPIGEQVLTEPVSAVPGWWLYNPSKAGVYTADRHGGAENRASCIVLSNHNNGSICQDLRLKHGVKYSVRLYAQKLGAGSCHLSLSWRKNGAWVAAGQTLRVEFKEQPGSDWLLAAAENVELPEAADSLVIIAAAKGQKSAQDQIRFSAASVVKEP